MPALLTFTRVKRKGCKSCDSQHGGDQEKRCLQAGRKIRQYCVKPQEEEVGFRCSLNDRRIRLPSRSVRSKHGSTNGDRRENGRREEGVLPNSSRYEWPPVLLRQFVIFR